MTKPHKRRKIRGCDWCDENRSCVLHLEAALRHAPSAYEVTIQLVIDALKNEVRGCKPEDRKS